MSECELSELSVIYGFGPKKITITDQETKALSETFYLLPLTDVVSSVYFFLLFVFQLF